MPTSERLNVMLTRGLVSSLLMDARTCCWHPFISLTLPMARCLVAFWDRPTELPPPATVRDVSNQETKLEAWPGSPFQSTIAGSRRSRISTKANGTLIALAMTAAQLRGLGR
jgi:hypothetical protein